jgi:hypothetical protein
MLEQVCDPKEIASFLGCQQLWEEPLKSSKIDAKSA